MLSGSATLLLLHLNSPSVGQEMDALFHCVLNTVIDTESFCSLLFSKSSIYLQRSLYYVLKNLRKTSVDTFKSNLKHTSYLYYTMEKLKEIRQDIWIQFFNN